MPAVGRNGLNRQQCLRALAGQIHRHDEHGDDREQRSQRDDAEARQGVVAAPGRSRHADADRQHQRHRHRPGCDGAAVPGEADDGRQVRLLRGPDRERQRRRHDHQHHHLEPPAEHQPQHAEAHGKTDASRDRQHQPQHVGAEQLPQPWRALTGDRLGRRLQGADGRLGEGRAYPKQHAEAEQHRRMHLTRHVKTDVLGKGHQATLDPLHEEHQTDGDGQDAEQDSLGVQQRTAQRQRLKADQQQPQRHNGAQLLGKANRDIRRQQAMQIHAPQPRARRLQPFGLKNRRESDLSFVALDRADIGSVSQLTLAQCVGHLWRLKISLLETQSRKGTLAGLDDGR